MKVLFFPALVLIRLFEHYIDTPHNRYMRSFFPIDMDTGEEDDPSVQDPLVDPSEEEGFGGRDGSDQGLRISKVKFEDIVKKFPDPAQSAEDMILGRIKVLQAQIDALVGGQGKSLENIDVKKVKEEDDDMPESPSA